MIEPAAPDDVAAEYLEAKLELRRLRPIRAVWMAVVAASGAGDPESISEYDLVVTRIDSGAEVIRTKADVGDPRGLLGQVELDLETKTVMEFLSEWRSS